MKHLNIKTDLPEEFINRPFEKLLNGTEKAIEQLLDTQKDRRNRLLRNFQKDELIELFEKQSREQNFNF